MSCSASGASIKPVHYSRRARATLRRYNAMRLRGIDADVPQREDLAQDLSRPSNCRCKPLSDLCGLSQPPGRHGSARCGGLGLCPWRGQHGVLTSSRIARSPASTVTRFRRGAGVQTSRGPIKRQEDRHRVAGLVPSGGHGRRAPADRNHVLQAFVSEPVKPSLHTVVSTGAGALLISPDRQGRGWSSAGNWTATTPTASAAPCRRSRKLVAHATRDVPGWAAAFLRQWAGVMDMTHGRLAPYRKLPVEGLYMSGGWCYGGFKATPGSPAGASPAHDGAGRCPARAQRRA